MVLKIKLKRSQELRLARHLAKEHPITKGKIKVTKKNGKSRFKKTKKKSK